MDLSVVIPVQDERDNLRPLYDRLRQALDPLGLAYELIVVDDGSTDGSFAVLEELAADPRLKALRLWRHFGQTAALQAGIDAAAGAVLVTLDGDLQNDPADIPRLLEKLAEGYDVVLGERVRRHDAFLTRRLPSLVANGLIRRVTGVPIRDLGCTLRALRRDLAEALPLYGDMHRFVPVLAQHYGARLAQVPVRHHPRVAGQTKYTLWRSFAVVLDLITVQFLHSYLTRPMHVLGLAGLVAMGLGVLSLAVTMWMKARYGVFLTGNPLLLLSALLELVGVQFLLMGLLGEVLTRTYFESQGKKAYAVRATRNLDPPGKRRRWNAAAVEDQPTPRKP
jgi:glycosyltransferase involved in cell wall biosynthesis